MIEHHLSTEQDPHTTYGEGFCKLVWIDHESGRPVALPEHLRAQLQGRSRAL